MWFTYYAQPRSNYRLSPIDINWDKTDTYFNIRRFQKAFHRRYGDLFLRLVSTKVMFYPKPMGGGQAFAPDSLIAEIHPDNETKEVPLLIGEFVDIRGRNHVMFVNNSMQENIHFGVIFEGNNVETYSWDWDGKEYKGKAYPCTHAEKTKKGKRLWHWLAPGQEAVCRIESKISDKKEK
jgi:hypothetical protein